MGRLYGEGKFVLLFGGHYTEMASYRILDHWLEGTGRVESFHEAKIAKPGIAESFLKVILHVQNMHCIFY